PPALASSACRDPPGPRDPVRARQERPAAPDRDPPVNACSRHYRERVFMTIREKGDIRHGANTFPRNRLWKTTFRGTPFPPRRATACRRRRPNARTEHRPDETASAHRSAHLRLSRVPAFRWVLTCCWEPEARMLAVLWLRSVFFTLVLPGSVLLLG